MPSEDALSVGVVTLPGAFNFGNRLQCRAVAGIWERVGFAPVVYDYRGWSPWGRSPYRCARSLGGAALRALGLRASAGQLEDGLSAGRREAFVRFDAQMRLERIEGRLPRNLGARHPLFSVGSDQVWNPGFMRDPAWYMLRFASREKRVALCPSIGVSSVSRDDEQLLRRGLAGFEELSVREEDGAALIRRLTGREATVLVDPTLMLAAAEWRVVADGRLTPAVPYVFAYILGGEDSERDALIVRLAAGRPVIRISDRDNGTELPAGPAEFIDLVDHAALVVTDSFHACVFATLLSTPLVAVVRAGGEHMAGRIDTLAVKLGLARVPAEKVRGGAFPDASSRADWLMPTEATPQLLASERRRFADYLAGAFDARGFVEQAALARAAWVVSADDALAAAGPEGSHERLSPEEFR